MAKRNTKIFIFKIKYKIIKIPLSLGAWIEIQKEREAIKQAMADSHFSNYVLEYKYFFGLPVIQYLQAFNKKIHKELIKKYFKKSFTDFSGWEIKKLKYLIEADIFLNFVKDNIFENYHFWKTFLNNSKIPQSSAHGDFHQDNILIMEDKLYFIDWSRFSVSRSRLFDLIDYYIFSTKEETESWMDVWLKELNELPRNIFGMNIRELYWHSYAVWKISDEIKILKTRNSFNEYKRKKYIMFFTKFYKILKARHEKY